MTLAGFVAYSGALAIAAAIPGPGVTALVARALGSGFRSSLFMSLGLILGDLTYLTAVVLGLAMIAQTFGTVFLVIKWAGVAYLAYLAWGFWTSGISAEKIEAKKSRGGAVSSIVAGLAVTLGNPKTMLFYIALTPTRRPAYDHPGRLFDPGCADRFGFARGAGAISRAGSEGTRTARLAASTEAAEPHGGSLYGWRCARHCRALLLTRNAITAVAEY
jgi:arginine exporter protein ArgO